MRVFLSIFFIIHLKIDCHLTDHLKKIENASMECSIEGIDFLYLINLDHRTEKLNKSLKQLEAYGITPYRFSAINGWTLTSKEIEDVGLIYSNKLDRQFEITYFIDRPELSGIKRAIEDDLIGKPIFGYQVTPGAIGCTLSHLSVLQHALDQNYSTILVFEDDIIIKTNPHTLSEYIQTLDNVVGKENWDILYTDTKTLTGSPITYWRPDSNKTKGFESRKNLGTDFIKIKHRFGTHSMIIKRSGILKILDYIKTHKIFLPYDNELAHVPKLNMYMLKTDVITYDRRRITDIETRPPKN